ncbi:class I SAM-dependent methyltransferase [Streptomyces sp. NPDC001941]|uniref:class I SAM-dependent methyltransferase n=1 Tax=Streptomyces sp. NPDC001941 TaxID=3154659 RepID=UPI003332A494
MSPLLSNRLAKRVLKPAFTLVEQRLERATHALQSDMDALHHEIADLRRRQYGLGLLLDRAGRDGDRMPTATQVDTLVREVRAVTGDESDRVRHDVTVAYRHLVAVEALGVGSLAGSVSDVCGRLATVPLLAPAGGDVLEVGGRGGLFAAALRRMLLRAGARARVTLVAPGEDSAHDDLSLGGGGEVLAGLEEAAGRAYQVLVVGAGQELAPVLELAAPGAIVVVGGDRTDTGDLTLLGRVADSTYLKA